MSTDSELPNDDRDEEQHETNPAAVENTEFKDEYERAPQDFETDIEQATVEVPTHPVKVYPKVRGEQKEAAAYLVTQGDIADRIEGVDADDDDVDATEVGVENIVELLNEKYVSPEFSLTAEDYRNSPAGYYDEFFNQIVPELGN